MHCALCSSVLLLEIVFAALPTCDPSRRDDVCIGVHGVPAWADDDSNADYVRFVNKYDKENAGSCGGVGSIGQIDKWGGCSGSDNTHVASANALHVNSSDFASLDMASQKLVATHKVWGSSAAYTTQGVVKENIETGVDTVRVAATGEELVGQNVMLLHFRGDAYGGAVQGLKRSGNSPEQCGFACPNWEKTSDGKRTGAVVATKDNFGPGYYHVRAMVPKTSDSALRGRGYVFAIWTFHYEEIYRDSKHERSPQYVSQSEFPGFESGSYNDGFYTGHNHEIDIEIPANSPQLDWDTQLGWDTINVNTWIGDNAQYCDGCDVFYQQAQVNAPSGTSYVSETGEYHDYDFEWVTDPDDPSKNTVTWYFDGQLIFSTQKFIPTRAGRLLIGPWPASWGSNKRTSTVDTATVKIAEISITPQATPLSFAQTFDQKFGDCDIACDFQPLPGTSPTPSPVPTPVPPKPTPAPEPTPVPEPTPCPSPAPDAMCEGPNVACPNGPSDCVAWMESSCCPSYTTYKCKDNGYCRIQCRPPVV